MITNEGEYKMHEQYYKQQIQFEEDLTIDLKKLFLCIWSRKILIGKVFLSIFILIVLSTFVFPKKYMVDADLYINKTNSSNMAEINPYFISEVGTGGGMAALMSGGGNLMNELEIMQSPLVIDKVIQENDLRFKKLFGIIPTVKTGKPLTTEKFLKKKVSFENKKGTNVVTISYKDKDKELAYNVVNSIINNYIALHKELNSEKSKSDKTVLEAEYKQAKADLNKKMNSISGMPANSMTGSGGLAAMSAFSKSAQRALSGIQGQYASGLKSEIALREDAEKVAELAKKVEWARLVENMSNSSNVVVLKEPRRLQDYEQTSPKLLINIVLGIVFGAIAALFAVIFVENTDKNLTYSMLGDNIIYNFEKDFIDLKSILLAEKNPISLVVFEKLEENFINELSKFKNINFVKADISEEFENGVQNSSKVILLSAIGKTNSKEYKHIKEFLGKLNKEILVEVLV